MIIDHCRDVEELRKLYEERPMPLQYDFDWLINNPNLFCFYDEKKEGKFSGFITIQKEELEDVGKVLTLSGTSIKGIMPEVVSAINKICEAFNDNIYSFTKLRHAALVLRKAGFEKIGTNLYMRTKNG